MRQSNAVAKALALWLVACGSNSPGPAPAAASGAPLGPTEGASQVPRAQGGQAPGAGTPSGVVLKPVGAPPPLRARGESVEPQPGGVSRSPLFASCHRGFAPAAVPAVDVVRLGMLCGPSNGLALLSRTSGVVDEVGRPARHQWEADRGDCFLIFGAAEEGVEDLEVEVVGPGRSRVLLSNQSSRWVVAAEDRPFCAARAGTFEARFTTHGGRGAFAAAVWRGARMLEGRSAPPDARGATPFTVTDSAIRP